MIQSKIQMFSQCVCVHSRTIPNAIGYSALLKYLLLGHNQFDASKNNLSQLLELVSLWELSRLGVGITGFLMTYWLQFLDHIGNTGYISHPIHLYHTDQDLAISMDWILWWHPRPMIPPSSMSCNWMPLICRAAIWTPNYIEVMDTSSPWTSMQPWCFICILYLCILIRLFPSFAV